MRDKGLSFRRAVLVLLAAALSACAHGGAAPAPSSASAPAAAPGKPAADLEVVAIVERFDRAAHEEFLSEGDVIVTNVVGFAVMQPERFKTLVFAHTPTLGHPYVGTRPLLLGDIVELSLPSNWENKDLSLDDLSPRFRE
ncbi:MAG TPA: hypothetical protein VMW27_12360 [Thermoanaerobaculia bacterium]|nr:hypothetical protein [Thermoanaerobaculia bacterium]